MALGVTVDFTANIARFSQQIDRISGDLDRFQSRAQSTSEKINGALAALGVGLSVAGITAFVKEGIDAADALNDMSARTGIAVEQLAGFRLATQLGDTDMESFTAAANKLNIAMGKNSEAFAKLGIDARDPAEAFMQLADVMSSIEDPQQRAALGAKALGKAWADMAPLLLQGGDALRKTVEEGAKMSGITADMAEQAGKLNDQIDIMNARMGRAAVIAGGAFATGFNQLIEKIDQATQSGVTFNNVMMGIGDFAFQNVFDNVERIGTLSTEVNAINEKIVKARDALKNAQGDPSVPSPIRNILHPVDDKSREIAAEQTLNNLLLERDQLLVHISESRKKAESTRAAPDKKTIADFIGGGDGGEKRASAVRAKSVSRAVRLPAQPKAIEDVTVKYDEMIKQMEREIVLRGETTEIVKLQYDIQNGAYKDATRNQQIRLQQLAYEKDALEAQDKQWEALVNSANEYYDLKKSNSDLIQSGNIQSGFNEALANTQDKLKAGDINTEQAVAEFNKLGQAYNDEFVSPAKEATNELSQYAIEGARNMQDAFADFLFDPFTEGMDGLLDGFLDTVRRMAANAASAKIMEALFGDPGKSDGGGLLGKAATAIISSVFHDGGVAGGGGRAMPVSPLVFAGATRYHSGGIAGLKADEVPAILQRGELVISRRQINESQGGSDMSGISDMIARVFHRGGSVTSGGGSVSVSPSVFVNAPRYHSGGVAGLKPSQTLAAGQIMQPVNSRQQTSTVQSGVGDISVSTQVNVTGSGQEDNGNMAALGGIINSKIREVIVTEKRPGGLLA